MFNLIFLLFLHPLQDVASQTVPPECLTITPNRALPSDSSLGTVFVSNRAECAIACFNFKQPYSCATAVFNEQRRECFLYDFTPAERPDLVTPSSLASIITVNLNCITTTTTATIPITSYSLCYGLVDSHASCRAFALNGRCLVNQAWMLRLCPLSCCETKTFAPYPSDPRHLQYVTPPPHPYPAPAPIHLPYHYPPPSQPHIMPRYEVPPPQYLKQSLDYPRKPNPYVYGTPPPLLGHYAHPKSQPYHQPRPRPYHHPKPHPYPQPYNQPKPYGHHRPHPHPKPHPVPRPIPLPVPGPLPFPPFPFPFTTTTSTTTAAPNPVMRQMVNMGRAFGRMVDGFFNVGGK